MPVLVKVNVDEVKVQAVVDRVRKEVHDAVVKHGPMRGRHEAYAVIKEEFDEFWDEVKRNPRKMSDAEAKEWEERMVAELIQVAAMAVRAICDSEGWR